MKDIAVRCFAGLGSTAEGYAIDMSFKGIHGEYKHIYKPTKGNAIRGFYRRSHKMYGWGSSTQEWTIKLSYLQYARLFNHKEDW